MHSHPIAGSFFFVLGLGLFVAGATGRWSPAGIPGPLPASILIPFVFWQLAVWAMLLGMFFFRARGRAGRREPRFAL